MDLKSFTQAIQQIADEKGIPREKIIETIEMALAAAYKRDYGKRGQIVRATLEPNSGKVSVRQVRIVVDEDMIKSEEEVAAEDEARAAKLAAQTRGEEKEEERFRTKTEEGEELGEKKVRFNPEKHLMIEEARKTKPDVMPGEELEFPLEYHEEFGRIAAQTAKQVIIQRIREAEREAVFNEYKSKEGELINGIIQRMEGRTVFIDIGKTVGVLPLEEQIPYERYRIGARIKALITMVEKNSKGPGIFLSRTHPRFLKKLFEIEVPEIATEAVEIKAIAREPGSRSKVAVTSHEDGVDPVGSLVGQKGIRVITVIQELGGEKIDVVEWSENPSEFIAHSVSPAKVLNVDIDQRRKDARVTVSEEQLSLAIGKGGQNVRLAAKLTGWKIDIRSDKTAKISQVVTDSGIAGKEPPNEKAMNDELAKPEPLTEIPQETGKEKPKRGRKKKEKKEEIVESVTEKETK